MIGAASAGAWIASGVLLALTVAAFVRLAVTWPKPRPITIRMLVARLTDRIAARL